MNKLSKAFTPLEKVQIVKRHLIGQAPVSELCEEHGIAPALFHQWLEQFFQNGAAAFEVRSGRGRPPKYGPESRIRELEKQSMRKDQVLAELMAEHVALKKRLGLG
jgi:transposase-like protein